MRVPLGAAIVATAAVVAAGLVLYLGRGFGIYFDEWDFVLNGPHWTAQDLLRPHNEHWVGLTKLIYLVLFHTAGLRSHVPYLAVNAVLHALTGVTLFALLARRAGAVPALALSLTFLFLGRGADDMLLAFQMQFVGSVLGGLATLLLLDRPGGGRLRQLGAILTMTAAITFSGMGPFFLVAVLVDLALDRERRSYLLPMAVPVLILALWFAGYGYQASRSTITNPYSMAALAGLRAYVPEGIGAAIVGLFGLSRDWAPLALAAPVLLIARYAAARRLPASQAVGAAAGLLSMFVVIGAVRYVFGAAEAAEARYVYVADAFLAIIAADAVRDLRWTAPVRLTFAAAFAMALVLNVTSLFATASTLSTWFTSRQDPELAAVEALRGQPGIQLDAQLDPTTIEWATVRTYFESVDAFGPPVPPATIAGLASLPHAMVDRVVADVFGPAVRASVGTAPASGRCMSGGGTLEASIPGGAPLMFQSSVAGRAGVYLTLFGTKDWLPGYPIQPAAALDVPADRAVRVDVPAGTLMWQVRVELPAGAAGAICTP